MNQNQKEWIAFLILVIVVIASFAITLASIPPRDVPDQGIHVSPTIHNLGERMSNEGLKFFDQTPIAIEFTMLNESAYYVLIGGLARGYIEQLETKIVIEFTNCTEKVFFIEASSMWMLLIRDGKPVLEIMMIPSQVEG